MRFFEPDERLVQSIVDYANGRIILEVGFGQGDLMVELKQKGGRVFGIDPFVMDDVVDKLREHDIMFLPGRSRQFSTLIRELKDKGIVIFARPCHSNFVEETISMMSPGTEALYITIPENMEKYNDLGKYRHLAKEIKLEGSSVDNELIFSIC